MWTSLLLQLLILIRFLPVEAAGSVYCSQRAYGSPILEHCVAAWSNHFSNARQSRLFVEQQLRAKPSVGNWESIADPRPQDSRERIIQLPKWWSNGTFRPLYIQSTKSSVRPPDFTGGSIPSEVNSIIGDCNIALTSFAGRGSRLSVSASRWSDVAYHGRKLISTCLGANKQGGGAVMDNIGQVPGLSLFLWQDGAAFDGVMNRYMSAGYPLGIDPAAPLLLTLNGTHDAELSRGDSSGGLDLLGQE